MNLRFVEAFYWSAQLKSVTRAAERLFLTQSALSSRLLALEDELGVLLLDRRDKSFRLTPAGVRFLAHAERLLNMQRDILAELGAETLPEVSVKLGAIESVLHSWLIRWIESLRSSHPGLELELTVETTPVLQDQMRRGALDIAFCAAPISGEGIRTRPLQSMEMVYVGHKALHRRRRYALADLAEGELLTFQRGSQPYTSLLDLLRAEDITPKRVHAISSVSAMVQLVQAGFGVATLPRAAVAKLVGFTELKVLASPSTLPALPIHASHRADPRSRTPEQLVESAAAFIG